MTSKIPVTLWYDRSRALQWGFKVLFFCWGLVYRFYYKNVLETIIHFFLGAIFRRVYVCTPPFSEVSSGCYPFSKFFIFFINI